MAVGAGQVQWCVAVVVSNVYTPTFSQQQQLCVRCVCVYVVCVCVCMCVYVVCVCVCVCVVKSAPTWSDTRKPENATSIHGITKCA